ncbi:MAG: acetylglutamate kinase [Myxococcales bacterium]|nr:acetylglutamate kinase [Myxococcales bacterium]
MRELIEKAAILHEALPYIRRFHGCIFVIKYGGHAMVDPSLRNGFARDVVLMKYVGIHPVVVHGGGPQIDAQLGRLGIESERVEGLRVTDDRTMEVVEMVLGGTINKEIVSLIGRNGGRAVGLSGVDDRFLQARRLEPVQTSSGARIDTGRVGRIEAVRPQVLHALIEGGLIPVVAPLASGPGGESLNVNADTVAGEIAAAMGARKLVLMTDIAGVCDADGSLIKSLTGAEVAELRERGVIAGGMIPKVECGLKALASGVNKCHILDGREQHAVLLEIFTDAGIGTQLTHAESAAAPS